MQAKNKIERTIADDSHTFFDQFFYKEDGTLKDPAKNPATMTMSNLWANAIGSVDQMVDNFIFARHAPDFIYAYMLTKDYPENSGNKLNFKDIVNDNSQQMKDFKKKCAAEFIDIFSKDNDPTQNLNKFNTRTYPTMMAMAEAIMSQKIVYNDLSEKSSIEDAFIANMQNNMISNNFQQLSNNTTFDCAMSSTANFRVFITFLLEGRINYLASDNYINNTDPGYTRHNIMNSQAAADTMDLSCLGGLTPPIPQVYCDMVVAQNYFGNNHTNYTPEDFTNFANHTDNACTRAWTEPQQRENHAAVERAMHIAAQNHSENFFMSSIGSGEYDDFSKSCNLDFSDLWFYKEGIPVPRADANAAFNKLNKSLMYSLTGYPLNPPDHDKEMLVAATKKVYINGKTMLDYFHLDENNIESKIADCEKDLANMLYNNALNNGTDVIYVKNSKDNYVPVGVQTYVKIDTPVRESYASDDDFNAARTASDAARNELRSNREQIVDNIKKYNEKSKANANVLSCNLDAAQHAASIRTLKNNNMKVPAPEKHMDVRLAANVFKFESAKSVISNVLGKEINTLDELKEAVSNIYIGNKPLSEQCSFVDNVSLDDNKRMAGMIVAQTFNNIFNPTHEAEAPSVSFRDKNGDLTAFKLDMEEPVEPKPVRPISRFRAIFTSRRRLEENRAAVAEYPGKKAQYDRDIALYERCKGYNETVEAYEEAIKKDEKFGSPFVSRNIVQVQRTQRGISASMQTPALTQPAAQRDAAQNTHTMG